VSAPETYGHVSGEVDQPATDRTVAVISGRGARGVAPGCTEQLPDTGGDRFTNARRTATMGLIPLAASRAVAQLG
jgi:hypothetical protein